MIKKYPDTCERGLRDFFLYLRNAFNFDHVDFTPVGV